MTRPAHSFQRLGQSPCLIARPGVTAKIAIEPAMYEVSSAIAEPPPAAAAAVKSPGGTSRRNPASTAVGEAQKGRRLCQHGGTEIIARLSCSAAPFDGRSPRGEVGSFLARSRRSRTIPDYQ